METTAQIMTQGKPDLSGSEQELLPELAKDILRRAWREQNKVQAAAAKQTAKVLAPVTEQEPALPETQTSEYPTMVGVPGKDYAEKAEHVLKKLREEFNVCAAAPETPETAARLLRLIRETDRASWDMYNIAYSENGFSEEDKELKDKTQFWGVPATLGFVSVMLSIPAGFLFGSMTLFVYMAMGGFATGIFAGPMIGGHYQSKTEECKMEQGDPSSYLSKAQNIRKKAVRRLARNFSADDVTHAFSEVAASAPEEQISYARYYSHYVNDSKEIGLSTHEANSLEYYSTIMNGIAKKSSNVLAPV